MLFLSVLSLLVFSTAASAVPLLQSQWLASYLSLNKRGADADSYVATCDLSQASIPQAPIPLPLPAAGLSLAHVAIGRGTQNYTCDLTNATAVPVAIGAIASLFNASCLAADIPALLAAIPAIALDLPVPFSSDPKAAANFDLMGYHYFLNATTPFFDLDTPLHSYGSGAFKKVNASAAPADAMTGPDNVGDGAVPWLKLNSLDAASQVFQEVYRVNTAGGNPPSVCTGMGASFEVPYAAEYWLYAA